MPSKTTVIKGIRKTDQLCLICYFGVIVHNSFTFVLKGITLNCFEEHIYFDRLKNFSVLHILNFDLKCKKSRETKIIIYGYYNYKTPTCK